MFTLIVLYLFGMAGAFTMLAHSDDSRDYKTLAKYAALWGLFAYLIIRDEVKRFQQNQ